ncbi:MAG: M23 family metallopeptidase [Bacteroidota bacterium]
MRTFFIAVIATLFTLSSTAWAVPALSGGGEKGGTDSLSTAKKQAAGVQIKRLALSPQEINPNFYKSAHWDTIALNMYHVDMTSFKDTLTYVLHRPATGHEFTPPHPGRVTSGFGRRSLFGRKFHKGMDIDLETGDEVGAAMAGKVRIARYSNGYGNFVIVSHEGGLETLYGHMSELWVREGEEVQSGQILGLGGSTGQSTGSHLHFEVRVFGEQVDPALIVSTETLMPHEGEVKIDASWFNHLVDGNGSHDDHSGHDEHVHDEEGVAFHVVAEGETLDEICTLYELDKATLCSLNEIKPEDEIAEGTRLKLE